MIHQLKINKELWGEAVRTAAYLINRSLTRALNEVTPAELWHRAKVNIKNLKVFGCNAFVHKPSEK